MTIDKRTGLTLKEQEVSDHLVNAWVKFAKLEKQHPDDINDFKDSIHRLQELMAMRVVRRAYPEGWPTYKEDK